jgi:DNA helicase HerA-like ATPase
MKAIGTVISSFDGPSTTKFDFVIKDAGNPIHKGQFIQVETENGILIGRVDDIIKTNRYFMQAESVGEYEKSGKTIHEMFPVERWEYLVAKTAPLGVYDQGLMRRVTFPPSPGTSVKIADKKILGEFLGLDNDNGLNIGKIPFHDLETRINLTKLFQKHLAILAISGSGKSYLTSVLFEELMDRMDDLGRPAVIVIDPHGEYVGFAKDKKYGKQSKVFDRKSISVAASSLSPYQLMEFIPQISSAQSRELIGVIQNLKSKKKNYNFKELITAIETSEIKRVTKDILISWIMGLENKRLFSNFTRPKLDELVKPGQLSILDVSDFISMREKQIIVTYFARQLFNMRRQGKISPFILVVEEAHNFCPEGTRKEGALSRRIIETIAREGRKFHASLVLISQRPIQLSTTALSQCNTHIILRVTNPYDLDHISKSSEGLTSDVVKAIPGLRVGEALIVGEAVNHPVLVKVRGRKSQKSEKGIPFEEALLKYKSKLKKKDKDMEAFM